MINPIQLYGFTQDSNTLDYMVIIEYKDEDKLKEL